MSVLPKQDGMMYGPYLRVGKSKRLFVEMYALKRITALQLLSTRSLIPRCQDRSNHNGSRCECSSGAVFYTMPSWKRSTPFLISLTMSAASSTLAASKSYRFVSFSLYTNSLTVFGCFLLTLVPTTLLKWTVVVLPCPSTMAPTPPARRPDSPGMMWIYSLSSAMIRDVEDANDMGCLRRTA